MPPRRQTGQRVVRTLPSHLLLRRQWAQICASRFVTQVLQRIPERARSSMWSHLYIQVKDVNGRWIEGPLLVYGDGRWGPAGHVAMTRELLVPSIWRCIDSAWNGRLHIPIIKVKLRMPFLLAGRDLRPVQFGFRVGPHQVSVQYMTTPLTITLRVTLPDGRNAGP